MNPDRIVVGVTSERAAEVMREIFAPFKAPIMVTDLNSAELIKHASNSFLALKISYINALAVICEASGANVEDVADGMGSDKRIGRAFLNAGVGYGGSCFPKDVSAFIRISSDLGYDFQLLKEVEAVNRRQMEYFLKKVRQALWILQDKKIGVLGLAFKGNTDDVRASVAISIINQLAKEGAIIKAFDPKAMEKALPLLHPGVQLAPSGESVADDADAVLVLTEWNDFKTLNWLKMAKGMRTKLLFDGRNLLNPKEMTELGFTYTGVGR
jgi:UDPglucose 6-dehydrogenase